MLARSLHLIRDAKWRSVGPGRSASEVLGETGGDEPWPGTSVASFDSGHVLLGRRGASTVGPRQRWVRSSDREIRGGRTDELMDGGGWEGGRDGEADSG